MTSIIFLCAFLSSSLPALSLRGGGSGGHQGSSRRQSRRRCRCTESGCRCNPNQRCTYSCTRTLLVVQVHGVGGTPREAAEVEGRAHAGARAHTEANGAGSTRLQFRMRAASLRFITASKPPACLVKDRKLGTLKTDPAPLSPAPRAAACFMASGFCASLLPTWSTPLSAYAAPATPQPIANAEVMGLRHAAAPRGREDAGGAKQRTYLVPGMRNPSALVWVDLLLLIKSVLVK